MFELVYSRKAEKQFAKLEKNMQVRISSSLERIRIRPHSFVKRLVGEKAYSFRVGNLRIIMDIYESRLIILVLEIGHRKDIYEKL